MKGTKPLLCGTPKAGHVVVRQLRGGTWAVVAPSGLVGAGAGIESAVVMAEAHAEKNGLSIFIETLILAEAAKPATVRSEDEDED